MLKRCQVPGCIQSESSTGAGRCEEHAYVRKEDMYPDTFANRTAKALGYPPLPSRRPGHTRLVLDRATKTIRAEDILARLDQRIRYCEDMSLDLRDIGGRNADERADKFALAAGDLIDAKTEIECLRQQLGIIKDAYDIVLAGEEEAAEQVGELASALTLAAKRLEVAATRMSHADTEFGFKVWADEARAALAKVSS